MNRQAMTLAQHTASAIALRQVCSDTPQILADIHQDEINLVVWQRQLPAQIEDFAARLLSLGEPLAHSVSINLKTPDDVPDLSDFEAAFCDIQGYDSFVADLGWLVGAFACLLGARCVGVRLRALDKAMCPRFHVDHVAARLITTYAGVGSEWLEEGAMVRSQLGRPEAEPRGAGIRQMQAGDVALMKGEKWQGNKGAGLIHRSPSPASGQRRLILTLDWLD